MTVHQKTKVIAHMENILVISLNPFHAILTRKLGNMTEDGILTSVIETYITDDALIEFPDGTKQPASSISFEGESSLKMIYKDVKYRVLLPEKKVSAKEPLKEKEPEDTYCIEKPPSDDESDYTDEDTEDEELSDEDSEDDYESPVKKPLPPMAKKMAKQPAKPYGKFSTKASPMKKSPPKKTLTVKLVEKV
jgi:hypothetical protein